MEGDMENKIEGKTEAQIIPKVSVVEVEVGLPRSPRRNNRVQRFGSLARRTFQRGNPSEESPWPQLVRRTLYLLTAALGLATIGFMYEHSLPLSASPWLIT
jgi:hypothetical protein